MSEDSKKDVFCTPSVQIKYFSEFSLKTISCTRIIP